MYTPYISVETIDDLMRSIYEAIKSYGKLVETSKGRTIELTGMLLQINNPRARLSRTETRGRPFSCLGELCWYLAGSNSANFITYYIPEYIKDSGGDVIYGAYGPRFFRWRGLDQMKNITELLENRPNARRAVIQLFDSKDLIGNHKDIPCTCILQVLIRNYKLDMITYMRSNDIYKGLPHDIFSFTMIQEIFARILSIDVGVYKHLVGSIHLYEENNGVMEQFMNEGFQSTLLPMPQMPIADPRPAIKILLQAESSIRNGKDFDEFRFRQLDPYWADLIRMLKIYNYLGSKKYEKVYELRQKMHSTTYNTFIDNKLRQIRDNIG